MANTHAKYIGSYRSIMTFTLVDSDEKNQYDYNNSIPYNQSSSLSIELTFSEDLISNQHLW